MSEPSLMKPETHVNRAGDSPRPIGALERDHRLRLHVEHIAVWLEQSYCLLRGLDLADDDRSQQLIDGFRDTARALVLEQDETRQALADVHARAWVRRQMLAEADSIGYRVRHQQGQHAGQIAETALRELIDAMTRAGTPNFASEFQAAYRHGLVRQAVEA